MSVLAMGFGAALVAASASAGAWFGPSFSLSEQGAVVQTSDGLLSAEFQSALSGLGLLIFVLGTVAVLIGKHRSIHG
jgi:hypothetical protein